jgi:23S rRNA pseudouridine1911/1915/1917 synthase
MHKHRLCVTPSRPGATVAELAESLAGEAGRIAAGRGGAWLAGRRAEDPGQPVPVGTSLTLRLPPAGGYAELELGPADLAYEDEWLLAVHKGQGWYVGATPWDVRGNLLAALGRYLAARDGAAPTLHLAHQLDRDTSGVLLVSKSPAVNAPLQAAFAGGLVVKHYLGLCAGAPPWEGLGLRTGHGRAAGGRWRVYPLADVGLSLPEGGGRVKEARTELYVEARLAGAALVAAALMTGRTHQIRLHMAFAGYPLLGDTRYGGPGRHMGRELPGHMLHAASLRLAHPMTGAPLELSSPLPEAFRSLSEERSQGHSNLPV